MTQLSDPFSCLLVTIEIPATALASLETLFDTVNYCPADASPPSAQQYAAADVLYTLKSPANLLSVEQTPRLKLVQLHSAGVGHFTGTPFFLSLDDKNPLVLASASGVHVSPIAEHVLATTMMLYHKLNSLLLRGTAERRWVREADPDTGSLYVVQEIRGQTVGILGYGHIGRETARMAIALGAKVVACSRDGKIKKASGYIVPGTGDPDGRLPSAYFTTSPKSSLHAFLSTCDVVVNTLPSTPQTQYFMGAPEFKAMKGNAVFVNIGRGDTVDQAVMIEALKASRGENEPVDAIGGLRIGSASLDVTDPEPLPDGHELFTMPNVVLTPHMSGLSKTYFTRVIDLLGQNVVLMRAGKGALNAVRGKGEDLE